MKKNVLLINSGRRIVARILQDRADVNLSVISMPGYLDYYDDDTDLEVVDTVENLTAVRMAALRIRKRNPFDHVVAPSEWSVQAGGYIRSYFGLPGPDYRVANAFSNKYAMKQALSAAGIPVTDYRLLGDYDEVYAAGEELGWPLVIKRACGGGSEYVIKLRDADHARVLATDGSTADFRSAPYPLMAEQYVDIEAELHCDGIVVDGSTLFAPASRYLIPVLRGVGGILGSYTLPPDDPDARLMAAMHDRVVEALELTDGVTHLEVFKSARGYLVGEVAVRGGGGGIAPMLKQQYGVDLWETFVNVSIGDPVYTGHPGRARHMVEYLLPCPAGTVESITSAQELMKAPGMVYARVDAKVGDTLSGPVDSSVYAGIVVFEADDEAQVHQRTADVAGRFQVEVSDPARTGGLVGAVAGERG
jgi:biotin carboxylase